MSGFSMQQIVYVMNALQEMNSPVATILAKKWASWKVSKKASDHRAICALLVTAQKLGVQY